MSITLKRALKLRKEIESHFAQSTRTLPSVSVSLLVPGVDVAETIKAGEAALKVTLGTTNRLSSVLNQLRVALDDTNSKNGISRIMADIAHIERQIANLNRAIALPIADPATIDPMLTFKRKRLESEEANRYGAVETTVAIPYISQAYHDQLILELRVLRRLKETVDEKRQAANLTSSIQLAEGDEEFLRGLGLL